VQHGEWALSDNLKEKQQITHLLEHHRHIRRIGDREALQRTHHVLVAVRGPHTGVRETLLLDGGLGAFAGI
jgi:hypothetical protein